MVSFGGPGVMLLAVMVAAVVLVLVAVLLGPRVGWDRAVSITALLWTLVVVFVITLVPANGPPGVISAADAQTVCSMDYGGPAPDEFWIFGGGQRVLNTGLFVPSGLMLVIVLSRFRHGLGLVLPGLAGLVGCSVAIEAVQLELTRIGRSCDITDIVDNSTGAVVGTLLGLAVAALTRVTGRSGTRP